MISVPFFLIETYKFIFLLFEYHLAEDVLGAP